jgi:hypothetical protein
MREFEVGALMVFGWEYVCARGMIQCGASRWGAEQFGDGLSGDLGPGRGFLEPYRLDHAASAAEVDMNCHGAYPLLDVPLD